MRPRTILVLLVLLALAGAAYHLSARGRPGPRDVAGPVPVGKDLADAPVLGKALEDIEAAPVQPAGKGSTLTGRVVRRGEAPELPATPVEGVLVRLSAGAELPPREVHTGPGGRFELPDVAPRTKLLLEVDDPSSAYFAATFELLETQEAVRDLGDIAIKPAHLLRVIVLDIRREQIHEAKPVLEFFYQKLPKDLDALGARERDRELEATGGGKFALNRVPPGEHVVYTRAPGFAPGGAWVELPQKTPLEIQLRRGRRVTGRVLTLALEPIPEAQVLSFARSLRPDHARLTDAEGRFEFDNVDPAEWQEFTAKVSGFSDSVKGVGVHTDHVEFLLLREAVVTGRVVSEGEETPLQGAKVRLASMEKDEADFSAESDAQGLFEIKKALPGEYRLEVEHRDFLPDVAAVGALGEGTRIEGVLVKLGRGLTLRGSVASAATGEAIPGAKIMVHQHLAENMPEVYRQTESGLDGSFIVEGLAEGKCTVTAATPGYLRTEESHEAREGAAQGVLLALETGGVIEGRALGPAGEAVVGAKISLSPDHGEELWDDPVRITGADGQYRFDGLIHSEEYELEASHPSFARVKIGPMEAGPGIGPTLSDIHLGPAATIRGRVLYANGAGVAGAEVDYGRPDDINPSERTDEAGAFALEMLPAGAYDIDVSFPGWMGSARKKVTVAEGQTIEGVVLTLPAVVRITGRVVDSTGRGVEGADLLAKNERDEVESMSEADGRFVLEGIAPGEFSLSASKGGFVGACAWGTAPGADLLLRIEPLARVSGRLAARGRRVFQGASVKYRVVPAMSWNEASFVGVDNLGRFDFPTLAGRCTIVASVRGFAETVLHLDLTPGESREVVIQLEPGGTVEGIVILGEAGGPATDCHVRLEPVAGRGGGGDDTETHIGSDSNGKFRIADVAAGTYTLVAEDPNHAATRIEGLVVVPGQTTAVRVEVDRGQGIRGNVSRQGEPVEGARITVRKLDGRLQRAVTTSTSGAFEAAELPAGEYEVLCVAEGITEPRRRKASVEESSSSSGVIEPRRSKASAKQSSSFCTVDFHLGAALLRGRVTAEGKPIEEASVHVRLVDDRYFTASSYTDDSGEYAIELPATGEYRFEVTKRKEEFQKGFITLPPGASELRQDFEVGAR